MFILLIFSPVSSYAKIVLASGAGYRPIVDDLADAYTAHTGITIERIYGNMARVIAQAQSSGAVDMVLGDSSFLEKSKLMFSTKEVVGRGRLVIVFPKGSSFNDATDLLSENVTRIAIPDTSRAIYGKAATQYLQNIGIFEKVQPKLLIVATVPQAASYVVAGEVDYALINLTHARKIEKNIGGYSMIDEAAYSPINIIIGQMENASKSEECNDFIRFLKTDTAHKIAASHGI
jgi:molybdate transport system substrate-binding protein